MQSLILFQRIKPDLMSLLQLLLPSGVASETEPLKEHLLIVVSPVQPGLKPAAEAAALTTELPRPKMEANY